MFNRNGSYVPICQRVLFVKVMLDISAFQELYNFLLVICLETYEDGVSA